MSGVISQVDSSSRRRPSFRAEVRDRFPGLDTFTSKPGIWDPLVGIAYRRSATRWSSTCSAGTGGSGVGSDTDIGLGARFDWKPFRHFGFSAIQLVSFKFKKDVGPYEFSAKQTVGGPVVGIGL